MKNKAKKRSKAPIIGDMIFSLLTLPSAMAYIQEFFTNPESPDLLAYLTGTFIMMGIARLFRAFRYRRESKLQFVKFLIYGFLMLACSRACVRPNDSHPVIRCRLLWVADCGSRDLLLSEPWGAQPDLERDCHIPACMDDGGDV